MDISVVNDEAVRMGVLYSPDRNDNLLKHGIMLVKLIGILL